MERVVTTFARRHRVVGYSMLPTFVPGELLTALRKWRRVRVGDVVLVRDPREPTRLILKRCVAREGRMLDLRGDNPDSSTDSREFGLVAAREVRYVVVGVASSSTRRESPENPE